jgi:PAS domain S-box-containing protein
MVLSDFPNFSDVAVENLTEGVVFVNGTGEVLHMNPEALRVHGFSDSSVMLRRAELYSVRIETLEGRRLDLKDWPVNRLLRGERFQDMEVKLFNTSGEGGRDWIASYGGAPIFKDGKLIGGVLTVRDITQSKSDQLMIRHLADSMTQLAWVAKPDGYIHWYNQRWYEFTGLSPLEMEGEGWKAVCHPDYLEQVMKFLEAAWKKPEPWELTTPLRSAAGEWRWFLTRAVPLTDSTGRIFKWFGTSTDIHDERQNLELLRRSEERLSLAASSAEIGMWEWDVSIGLVNVTDIGRRLFDLPEERPINEQDYFDRTHPDDRRRIRKLLSDALEQMKEFSAEFRINKADGKVAWIFARGRAEKGKTVRMYGVYLDITERKEGSEKLLKTQAQLNLALESGNIGFWDWDLKTNHVALSDTFMRDWGIDPQTYNHTLDESLSLIHEEDRERTWQKINQSVLNRQPYDVEYRVVRPTGETIWIYARGMMSFGLDGELERVSGLSMNITDRKIAENALGRTTEILNSIMTTSSDVIYFKDRQSRMLYCNPKTLELIGKSEVELYGKNDLEFLGPGKGGEIILENDQRIMTTGVGEVTEEEVTWQDGRKGIYMSKKEPHRDANGEVIGLIGISRDISELKAIQNSLKDAVKARDEFLSIASHELKTPMTSLMLRSQMMQKSIARQDPKAMTPERLSFFADQTSKEITRLSRLVDDMLDVSRIRSGRLKLEKERLDFCALVEEVVERLADQFTNNAYPVPSLMGCKEAEGEWDRFRLEQVVTNLLTNAIRYGHQKPITIEVQSDKDKILLLIKDQGMGVAEVVREKIFEPFERDVNANDVTGLGLGLFISRQIVLEHGGRIWVESAAEGGSVFLVELPRQFP